MKETSEIPSRPRVGEPRNKPTPQDSRNFGNLLSKTTDPATITIDPIENQKKVLADVARVNEINTAKRDARQKDLQWRDELQELDRRLAGSWTEAQAKDNLKATTDGHNTIVKNFETEIVRLRKLLATPYLNLHSGWSDEVTEPRVTSSQNGHVGQACGCDGCAILKRIEHNQYELGQAKITRDRKIRLAASWVEGAKQCDKLRPRWKELKERAAIIDQATAKVRHHEEPVPAKGTGRLGYTGLQPEA